MIDLQRLRDRKIAQWAIAYLAGAWVVLQLLGLLADTFAWPPLVPRLATILLGIGFLVALVVAWYHGEKGAQRVGTIELLMLGGIMVIAGAAVGFFARSSGPRPQTDGGEVAPAGAVGAAAEQGSIAVLPFVNMSSDPEQEFFSEGLTEELLNVLAHLPELRVASRTSAFAFKGREVGIDSIGRALRVAHVLEGSVRKARNQVRITAQLIDVKSGYHLWSDTYDRDFRDVFAVQDEISRAIVAALKLRLSGHAAGGGAPLARVETADPEAHTLFLQATAAGRTGTNAGMRQAVSLYQAALTRDSSYVNARAHLALALGVAAYNGMLPREETYRAARAEALRALVADSSNAVALTTLGRIADWHDWDWGAARDYYERALAANPNDAGAHANLGWLLMRLHQPERALAEAQRAVELDPLRAGPANNFAALLSYSGQHRAAITQYRNSVALAPDATLMITNLAYSLCFAGDCPAAIAELQRARSLEPRDSYVLATLAWAYARAGRRADAEKTLAELRALPAVQRTELAAALVGLGRTDEAFEQLDKAVSEREDYVVDLGMDPVYEGLRRDPRFGKLLTRIGLK